LPCPHPGDAQQAEGSLALMASLACARFVR